MGTQFDATFKELVDAWAEDWARFLCARLGLPGDALTELKDSDLSTVARVADKLFDLGGNEGILQVEAISSYQEDAPERLALMHWLIRARYPGVPSAVLLLLRRKADGPNCTGVVEHTHPRTNHVCRFEYGVVRVWELNPDDLLSGGPGIWPLAALTDAAAADMPALVRRMDDGLAAQDTSDKDRETFRVRLGILMGLRYGNDFISQVLRRDDVMQDSTFYQSIVEEGVEKGLVRGRLASARELLRMIGEQRFGPASPEILARIDALPNYDALVARHARLLSAADWDDLLAG